MKYKIKQVLSRSNELIDVLEIFYFSPNPKKGGDIICLKKPPISRLSALTGLFENYRVFSVLSVRGNELIIKV